MYNFSLVSADISTSSWFDWL